MIVYGPWEWRDTGAGFAWTPPPGTTATLDLRSIDACGQPGGTPHGVGVFEVSDDPGLPYVVLADSATALVPRRAANLFARALGLTARLRRERFDDLLWEILTQHGDPEGHRLAPPLMPTARGELVLHFGDVTRSQILHVGDPEWPLVQATFQLIYRTVRADVLAGRAPMYHHRKMLTTFLRTMRTEDYRLFIPPDLPADETPLAPSTTITDDFNRANNPIGSSAEGWAWNALSGTWLIASLRARCSDLEAFCRAEFDLVSSNNTAQTTTAKSGSASFSGVIARFQAAANTGYIGFSASAVNDCRINKLVAGVRGTEVATGVGGVPNLGSILKVSADGSLITFSIDGVVVKTLTDSIITLGTRTGMWGYGGDDRIAYKGEDIGGAPATITATLTQTLGVLTAAATATVAATATLTQTLGALTCSARVVTLPALYAKAAGGNWSSASTWSAVSSAGSDSAGPPDSTTPYDVVFDAGSGNVTINADASCRSLICTGYTGTLTQADGATLAVGHFTPGPGNVLLAFSAGMTYTASALAVLSLNSGVTATPQTLLTAGQTCGAVTHNGTGSTILLDALTVTGPLIASDGTFNTAGQTVTCQTYSAVGVGTSVWGASTINLTRTSAGQIFLARDAAVIVPGTSNLVIATASTGARIVTGADRTYADLTYTLPGSTGGLTITGANTFRAIRVSDASNPRTLTLPAGAVTTVTTFAVNGTAGKLITVQSSAAGTPATLSSSNHQTCSYLSLKDSTTTGGGHWYASTSSTDVSNNTGWLFTDPAWTLTQTLGALTLTASAFIRAPDYKTMVAHDGATAFWPLDDPAGSPTAREELFHTRPGALVGDVVAGAKGLWGLCMDFHGDKPTAGGAGYIDLNVGGPPSGVVTTLPFSIDLWIYRRPSTASRAIFETGPVEFVEDGPAVPGSLALVAIGSGGTSSPYDRISVGAGYPPPGATALGVDVAPPLKWHYVAATYDGTTLRLYQNGVFQSEKDAPMGQDEILPSWLGDYPWYADRGYAFDGKMQAVAVYDRALTYTQILEHYLAGRALAARRRTLSVLELAGDDDMLRYNIAVPIVPSDAMNLARATDAIYIGVGGDLTALLQNGETRTFVDLAPGSILPMIVTRINATATTAGSLLALYTQ